VRRLPHRQRKPAVAHRLRTERHFERPLRTDHEKTAAAEEGREAEQVLRIGAPAVKRENRRMRAVAGRLEDGVGELHSPDSCILAAVFKRGAGAEKKLY